MILRHTIEIQTVQNCGFKTELNCIREPLGLTRMQIEQNTERIAESAQWLVRLGWIAFAILYLFQASLFAAFWQVQMNGLYFFWCLFFLPAFLWVWAKFLCNKRFANKDKSIRHVWIAWGLYIAAFVFTVAFVFDTFAHKLTKDDNLGINALMGTLCITPALLFLLVHLTISPFYQIRVLPMSILAAVNILDGIGMLEIFLRQNDTDFDLNTNTRICIVVFACLCFLLSPVGLARNKFMTDGVVKFRKGTSMFFVQLEFFGINLPFLVLRAVVWHKYETAIFMAKNIICLVVGGIEFLILRGICKCEGNVTHHV